MDSRSLIKKVIEFDGAERIGYNFRNEGPNDFIFCGPKPRDDFDYSWHDPQDFISEYPGLENFNGYVRKDEFGNLWRKTRTDPSPQGEVIYGVLSDWDVLKHYKFPDISNPQRYVHIEKIIKEHPDKFRVGTLPGFPFSIMRKMRKMEFFLADLLLEKDRVLELNEMVVGELLKIIDNYATLGMDAIFFCEDWGTQDRLLINPKLWRGIFKPTFRRLCSYSHSRGMYVFMHSCGYIYEILEDLIEVGIDVFQLDQPALMGIDRLSSMFYKRVTLFSPVDIQKILPTGNKELIQASAREMVKKFGSAGGGFIARDYGDYATIQVKNEWVRWMHEAFLKYGDLKNI